METNKIIALYTLIVDKNSLNLKTNGKTRSLSTNVASIYTQIYVDIFLLSIPIGPIFCSIRKFKRTRIQSIY